VFQLVEKETVVVGEGEAAKEKPAFSNMEARKAETFRRMNGDPQVKQLIDDIDKGDRKIKVESAQLDYLKRMFRASEALAHYEKAER